MNMLCALLFSGIALAQGNINTYAGNDALFAGSGQPATAAQIVGPDNSAVDSHGNVYISASGLSMVLKVAAGTGIVSIFAGDGLATGGGDGGLAIGASLLYPAGLAFDSADNLYIVDSYNSNVRKVDLRITFRKLTPHRKGLTINIFCLLHSFRSTIKIC